MHTSMYKHMEVFVDKLVMHPCGRELRAAASNALAGNRWCSCRWMLIQELGLKRPPPRFFSVHLGAFQDTKSEEGHNSYNRYESIFYLESQVV